MNYSLVVAYDNNRGIGIDNKLPWKIKKDMQFFKDLTTNPDSNFVENQYGLTSEPFFYPLHKKDYWNSVIMGRNTWESIPEKYRPLPNRLNMILSNTINESHNKEIICRTFDIALDVSEDRDMKNVYVIGGASVYKQCVKDPRCTKIYATEINHEFECDTFFPNIDEDFKLTNSSEHEENGQHFKFTIWQRK